MSRRQVIAGLEPAGYSRHSLHGEERVWVEKNCYFDVWIELVHALGGDPVAMAPCVFGVEFEGDQWTFFKPAHSELRDLYGLDVQELNVWRPILEHALEHLSAGRLISTEADAYWLPDTQGTDYRRQHTKTTIVINDLDVAARRMGYFHNAGYHAVDGDDFDQLFRVGHAPDPTFMPLYAEFVRTASFVRRDRAALRAIARRNLKRTLALRQPGNPLDQFAARFAADMPALIDGGLAHYHAWAFGTIRQLGAAAEMAALFLSWLDEDALAAPAAAFTDLSMEAKALILKAARAVNARRPLDATLLESMAGHWRRAMAGLVPVMQG